VARSLASRSGFSQPSGITAVPSSMRSVRCDAAASTATGDEMPYCRWRCRTQALSKPNCSPSSMISSVGSCPRRGSDSSDSPMVRNPSFRNGSDANRTPTATVFENSVRPCFSGPRGRSSQLPRFPSPWSP
jgi:hypothetical protein